MAKCPACGVKLRIWNIFAECPKCGVNIPNHNWHERLEEDARIAEEKFDKLYRSLAALKYAMAGTPLRIARLPVSVAPYAAFFLPLVHIAFYLPYRQTQESYGIIGLVKAAMSLGLDGIKTLLADGPLSGEAALLAAAAGLTALGAATLPVGFVFLVTNFRHLKSKGLFFTSLFAALCVSGGAAAFQIFFNRLGETTVNALDGSVAIGLYACAALFCLSAAVNLLVAKSKVDPAKLEPKKKEAPAAGKPGSETP